MNELKPCPFCGGEATLVGFSGNWYVRCDSCLATSDDRALRQTVIDAWNTRAVEVCEIEGTADTEPLPIIPERTCHDLKTLGGLFVCSNCGEPEIEGTHPNYCPNCGAKVVSE